MTIEEKLKTIVKSKGLKMEFVYTSIGMTNSGFYKMLRNETYTVNTLQRIADVLEVPITDFFVNDSTIKAVEEAKDHLDYLKSREWLNNEPKDIELIRKYVSDANRRIASLKDLHETLYTLMEYTASFGHYQQGIYTILENAKENKKYQREHFIRDLKELVSVNPVINTLTLFQKVKIKGLKPSEQKEIDDFWGKSENNESEPKDFDNEPF
jgi:transcriptional regulator with XRE-family HTH domain